MNCFIAFTPVCFMVVPLQAHPLGYFALSVSYVSLKTMIILCYIYVNYGFMSMTKWLANPNKNL